MGKVSFFALGLALVSWAGDAAAAEESLLLRLSTGRRIVATLVRPDAPELARRKLPAVLVFGGFQKAGEVLKLLPPDIPAVLASFDYPFDPPREFRLPGSLRHLPEVRRLPMEMTEGIALLLEELARRPDVNPEQLSVIGASLGAPFALLAAAESPRLRGLVLVHGFGDVPRTAQRQLERSWQGRLGPLTTPAAWLFTRVAALTLQLPSPEAAARRLPADQSVLVIRAEADSFIPAEVSESLARALGESRAKVEVRARAGDHLQPGADAMIRELLREVTSWLQSRGLA